MQNLNAVHLIACFSDLGFDSKGLQVWRSSIVLVNNGYFFFPASPAPFLFLALLRGFEANVEFLKFFAF